MFVIDLMLTMLLKRDSAQMVKCALCSNSALSSLETYSGSAEEVLGATKHDKFVKKGQVPDLLGWSGVASPGGPGSINYAFAKHESAYIQSINSAVSFSHC